MWRCAKQDGTRTGCSPLAARRSHAASEQRKACTAQPILRDLRDDEIERLLQENARLNARVVALLKVIEQEQAIHAAETATETAPAEVDRDAICREVRGGT